MSCQKNYCPNKLTVCCKDCIRNATNFCQTVCEGADQENCKNYRDEDREKEKRKQDRTMIRCLAAILILVLLLFGAALLRTWWVSARDTGTEATKKGAASGHWTAPARENGSNQTLTAYQIRKGAAR